MLDSAKYIVATYVIICIWQIIEGCVFIKKKSYRKNEISKRRLFSWNYSLARVFKVFYVFDYVRVLLALIVIISSLFFDEYLSFLITFFLFFQSFYNYFFKLIIDVSDKLTLIIILGLQIEFLFGNNTGVIFISLNTLLTYMFTGLKKLIAKEWRNGNALFLVMNTENYGNYFAARFLLDNKLLNKVMCWFIILFQLTFPLAILNTKLAVIYIIIGVLFHLGIMIIMRLYNFFFAFLATYPAIFLCASLTQDFLSKN